MVGRKVNLKGLVSKLWKIGVSTVQTTEFIQGQTFRWGLAWSFVPLCKKIPASKLPENTTQSFMLEVSVYPYFLFNSHHQLVYSTVSYFYRNIIDICNLQA